MPLSEKPVKWFIAFCSQLAVQIKHWLSTRLLQLILQA